MYGELLETLLSPKQQRRRSHLTMKAPAEQTIKQLYQYQDRRVYPSFILLQIRCYFVRRKTSYRTTKRIVSPSATTTYIPCGRDVVLNSVLLLDLMD